MGGQGLTYLASRAGMIFLQYLFLLVSCVLAGAVFAAVAEKEVQRRGAQKRRYHDQRGILKPRIQYRRQHRQRHQQDRPQRAAAFAGLPAQLGKALHVVFGVLLQPVGFSEAEAVLPQFLAQAGQGFKRLVVAGGALLHLCLAAAEPLERLLALSPAALGHLPFKLSALGLLFPEALVELFGVLHGGAHLLEPPLGLVHFALKLGQKPLAVIAPPPLPGAKPFVRLRVGAGLLAGGDDGADALFKLGAAGDADVSLGDKGAAAEHVLRHTGQKLAGV